MIIYLNKTTYQEFDAWLCNKAGKYKFRISYDETGLIDDLGELDKIPKEIYPLRIFLSKIYPDGRQYDQDGVFIIEKVGKRLKVCPKAFAIGVENLKPILKEIADDWPETREIIMREVFKISLERQNDIGVQQNISQEMEQKVNQSNMPRIAPSRPADFDKWKAVWNYIKPKHWLEMGMSPAEIRESLEKDHTRHAYHGKVYSIQIIKKIIRSGRADELS
jgi:hypothetical protein